MYLNDWSESGVRGMVEDFFDARWCDDANAKVEAVLANELAGAEILLASYTYEDYSGTAFVLFRKDGKLYEVNGSHCSCYGLEGQWEPEETTVDALRLRLSGGCLGKSYGEANEFADELDKVLAEISA